MPTNLFIQIKWTIFPRKKTFSMLNITRMLKRNLKNSSVKTQSSRAEQEASLTQTEIS